MRFRAFAWIAGGLVLVGVAVGIWQVSNQNSPPAPEQGAASPQPRTMALSPRGRDEYAGDEACSSCHAEIAGHYARSPMSRSWSTAPVDFALPAVVSDPNGPYVYACRIEEGRVVQEEQLDDGSPYKQSRAALYFVGSGNHAQAMVSESNGYLTQLPAGWFPHENQWKLNPGYELKNHRFDRPILPGCLACHGGYAAHVPPTRNRYHGEVSGGITCEQCHGPGQGHIAFREGAEDGAEGDPIVHPGRLSAARSLDVCLQCHLQGDVVVYRDGAGPFSFLPGEQLSDHRLDFLIRTKDSETFGVASHGSRMMQSPCFTESDGRLTCITCHDPHRPVGDFSSKQYDAKCAVCHQPESCSRVPEPNGTKDATGCVRCHMPRRSTREGLHLVYTDHWIRKTSRQPALQTTPPLLKADADVTLAAFPPGAAADESQLGIAYVKLHSTMGPQRPSLARGVALLETALAARPDDLQVRYWLATGQIAQYQSEEAVSLLARVLEKRPDWHEARFRLAVAYHQLQRYREAIAAYESVIRDVPDWMEPYPLVVRLHLSQRNTEAAAQLLNRQLSYRGDATAYLSLALVKQLEGKPIAECLEQIDESLRLDPRNPTAFTTRAYLFVQAGRNREAGDDYRKALEIDPGNAEAIAGLRALGQTE